MSNLAEIIAIGESDHLTASIPFMKLRLKAIKVSMIEDLERIQSLLQQMQGWKDDDDLLDKLNHKQVKSLRLQLEKLFAQRK